MNNELNGSKYLNNFYFHLNHEIKIKPAIGLLNIVIDKLEELNLKIENLDRKLNYIIYHIFLISQELTKIEESLSKISFDLQRIITLERVFIILLNRSNIENWPITMAFLIPS